MKHNKTNTLRQNRNKINNEINSFNVRVVGSEEYEGPLTKDEALKIAFAAGKDLVEVSEKDGVSIVKIIDYNKYLFQQKQKEKEQKQKSVQNDIKEIRLSAEISDNDINHKLKSAIEFIEKNHKVRLTMMFKGRSIVHSARGELVMLNFIQSVSDIATPESLPKLEGKKMMCILKPAKAKNKN